MKNNNTIKNIKRVMPWQSFQQTASPGEKSSFSLLIVIYPSGGGVNEEGEKPQRLLDDNER